MKDKRTRPRILTLTLPDTKQPRLRVGEGTYLLRNFNEGGVGLCLPKSGPLNLSAGGKIKGEIHVNLDCYSVQLEVAHLSDDTIGLRFTKAPDELIRTLRWLLEPSHYAHQLKMHARSGETDGEGLCLTWYHGPGPSELLIWSQGISGPIQRLQLCYLGRWIFREADKKAQTGFLHEDHLSVGGRRIQPAELLLRNAQPDPHLLSDAAQFLSAVPTPLSGPVLLKFLEAGQTTEASTASSRTKHRAA